MSIDFEDISERIRTCPFEKRGLLYGAEDAERIRDIAASRDGMLEELQERCREIVLQPTDAVEEHTARNEASDAHAVAMSCFFVPDTAFADWAKRRIKAVLNLENWMYPAHRSLCKHSCQVMTNIGSLIARAHHMLESEYSHEETRQLAASMRQRLILPFLDSVRERVEWWTQVDHESNWKIMCYGETGLVVCEFVEEIPEAREVLVHAAQGVLELLDRVPPEGDWPEGFGYWIATLNMGMQYATALRRLTDGAVNLYEHPAFKVTGDYMMMLATPGGSIFNFNDNKDYVMPMQSEGLARLAAEMNREDWMHVARMFPADTPEYLAYAPESAPSRVPERTTALFPVSGVATMRSGWGEHDTFVGVKCCASAVPHSHLDAGSFVIESGGQWLVKDEGYWRYGHSLGFFDDERLRWNWDGLATVGHSSLLIDGQGQRYGHEYPGNIRSLESGEGWPAKPEPGGEGGVGWDMVIADASKTYPDLLRKFVRSVLFLWPDTIVIRDVVECEGERHAEWLLHYAGSIRSEGLVSVIENNGVSLSVVPFLPDRSMGWRSADVESASTYMEELTKEDVTETIRYRSFSPFRKAEAFEFLFGLRVNGKTDGSDWEFEETGGGWTLQAADRGTVRPEQDTLCVE